MSPGRHETLSKLNRPVRRPTATMEAVRERPPERRGLGGRLRGALFDNAGLKLLSLILAATVFMLVNSDENREINARVRVAYVLPEDKALVSQRIDEVQVTVRGPWRRIKRFDEREIDRIDIDLTRVTGGEVTITPEMIDVPRGLEITSITPRVIPVAFEDIEHKQVPVVPSLSGRPLHGYQVVDARTAIEPRMVTVSGAAGVVRALESVRTQEIRIDGLREGFTITVEVVPPTGTEVDQSGPVEVSVAIEEELVTRKLTAPIVVRGEAPAGFDPLRWAVTPTEVQIVLTGGLLAVERWIEDGVVAAATVPADAMARGRLELTVTVEGAPAGVGVQVTPPQVRVTPRK